MQEFFADPELQGINITIPYKVNALEACDVVDPRAERIGCVNTMVRKDGKWHGYNTDYDGFRIHPTTCRYRCSWQGMSHPW